MRHGTWLVAAALLLAACASEQGTARVTLGEPVAPQPLQRSGLPVESHEIVADLCLDYCEYLLAADDNDCPEPQEDLSLCTDYLDRIRLVAVAVGSRLDRGPGLAPMLGDLRDSTRSVVDEHAAFVQQQCTEVQRHRTPEDAACAEQAELIRERAAAVGELLSASAGVEAETVSG